MQPQRDPLLGTTVGGRYRLLQRIAATEMSLVYRAIDQASNQRVAVKLLHASRENLAERCLREAAAMAALQSPHVVRALDFGRTDTGHVFLAMEYLAGENLAETLRREGPLAWPRVIHIGRQLCEALLATHAAGIIHRDVKPANCMRLATAGDPDFVKLLDFGISKNLDRSLPSLTGTGVVLGTPAYMAPELIATGSPTVASDIYALGATLYQLTTGALPFAGQTALDFYYHHQFSPLIPASQRLGRALPPALDELFTIAMAKEAGQRFADIASIRAALDALAPAAAPLAVGEDSLEVRPTRPYLPAIDAPTPTPSPSLVWGDTEPAVTPEEWPHGPLAPSTPGSQPAAPAIPTLTAADEAGLVPWSGVLLRAAVVAVMALVFATAAIVLAPVTWPEVQVVGDGLRVAPPPPLASGRPDLAATFAGPAAPTTAPSPSLPAPTPASPPASTPASTPAPPPAPAKPPSAPVDAAAAPYVDEGVEAKAAYPRRRAIAAAAPARPALRVCGQKAKVWGLVRVGLRVDAEGRLLGLRLVDPAGPESLATCLEGHLRPIPFPAHPGGGSFELTVDIPAFLPVGG